MGRRGQSREAIRARWRKKCAAHLHSGPTGRTQSTKIDVVLIYLRWIFLFVSASTQLLRCRRRFITHCNTNWVHEIFIYLAKQLIRPYHVLRPVVVNWHWRGSAKVNHSYHAVSLPCSDHAAFAATSQGHGMGTAWYVWITTGRQVRFLPTTTRSCTIGSRDFSGYTRTFTKDTTLSGDGRGTACVN